MHVTITLLQPSPEPVAVAKEPLRPGRLSRSLLGVTISRLDEQGSVDAAGGEWGKDPAGPPGGILPLRSWGRQAGPMKTPRGYRERLVLMDRDRLTRTLKRMATEIVERHPDQKSAVLVGVRSRGVPMALRLARMIAETAGDAPPVGALDITLYRDDLTMVGAQPVLTGTEIPVSIDGRTVIVVDDVLFTGRSVRGALDELIDFGRPARIELAVLVDRGHRELPIHADYVGRTVTTARDEIVQVMLKEQDGEDGVVLFEKEPPRTKKRSRPKARPARRARPVGRPKPRARGRVKARARARRRK